MSRRSSPLAGFQVTFIGRIWVTAEVVSFKDNPSTLFSSDASVTLGPPNSAISFIGILSYPFSLLSPWYAERS